MTYYLQTKLSDSLKQFSMTDSNYTDWLATTHQRKVWNMVQKIHAARKAHFHDANHDLP